VREGERVPGGGELVQEAAGHGEVDSAESGGLRFDEEDRRDRRRRQKQLGERL
jgi:hypothetical protein